MIANMLRPEIFINQYRSDLPMPKVGPNKLILWPEVPWSFTNLNKFETCARQYGEVVVNRQKYPFKSSAALEHGNQIHKMLENYIQLGSELPMGLTHIKAVIDTVAKGATQVTTEQDISFTHLLQICDKYDRDVSYRGRIDMLALHERTAFVIDFKTGSAPREGDEQLVWMAIAVLLKYPQYDSVFAMFVYTKHDTRRLRVNRADIARHVDELNPRLQRLADARQNRVFLPTPGWQCQYCPVVTCEHHRTK